MAREKAVISNVETVITCKDALGTYLNYITSEYGGIYMLCPDLRFIVLNQKWS